MTNALPTYFTRCGQNSSLRAKIFRKLSSALTQPAAPALLQLTFSPVPTVMECGLGRRAALQIAAAPAAAPVDVALWCRRDDVSMTAPISHPWS
jgi:hypothetical protein